MNTARNHNVYAAHRATVKLCWTQRSRPLWLVACLIAIALLPACTRSREECVGAWCYRSLVDAQGRLRQGTVTYKGQTVPEELAQRSAVLKTPVGTFEGRGPSGWLRTQVYVPPLSTVLWNITINSTPLPPAKVDQGWYETTDIPELGPDARERAVAGTPPNWVFLLIPGANRGFWVDPDKLRAVAEVLR